MPLHKCACVCHDVNALNYCTETCALVCRQGRHFGKDPQCLTARETNHNEKKCPMSDQTTHTTRAIHKIRQRQQIKVKCMVRQMVRERGCQLNVQTQTKH